MLESRLYISHENWKLDDLAYQEMVDTASQRNKLLLVTGFLCHYEDKYFQYLEGSPSRLDMLMKSIRLDKRHNIRYEISYKIKEKLCPEWSMIALSPMFELSTHHGKVAENIFDLFDKSVYGKEKVVDFFKSLIVNWTGAHKKIS